MISVKQALEIVEKNSIDPRSERLPLAAALGRRLAEDLTAPEPSPRYTNSAMDGFAVRWVDVAPAAQGRPVELPLAGESRAGVPLQGAVGPGAAARISTGAMLPAGVDSVVKVEDTEPAGDAVRVLVARAPGQNVRLMGEEFSAGDPLLARGQALHAPQLALLAGVGADEVSVFAAPRVAVVVTGTELTAPGEAVAPHQVRDSNSTLLAAAVRQAGAEVVAALRARDSLDETVDALTRAAGDVDVVLVSGGVSVGPHDHVKAAAEAVGFRRLFWRVRQKPGKPLLVARRGDALLFGLPGNPVSAYMCFMLYAQPHLRRLQGHAFSWPTIQAPPAAPLRVGGERTNFVRVRLRGQGTGARAEALGRQGSHMQLSLAAADGFVVAEPGREYPPDEALTVRLFPWCRR